MTNAAKTAAANVNIKEKEFWMRSLKGPLPKSVFPYDENPGDEYDGFSVQWQGELYKRLASIANRDHRVLHIVLMTLVSLLLERYTGIDDTLILTPIYKQPQEEGLINTGLLIRQRCEAPMTFKERLIASRQVVSDAIQHQDYPLEVLLQQLAEPEDPGSQPSINVSLTLEPIHDRRYLEDFKTDIGFYFLHLPDQELVEISIEGGNDRYSRQTLERMGIHLTQLLESALENLDSPVDELDMLTSRERQQLLHEFNDNLRDYNLDVPLHRQFERRAGESPHAVALVDGNGLGPVTYRDLNGRGNRLARFLKRLGVGCESVVGVMMDPSTEMIVVLLGILKGGGAYLPIDTTCPQQRVLMMMEDAGAHFIFTGEDQLLERSFTELRAFDRDEGSSIHTTTPRPPIQDFAGLPVPDRSIIDLSLYKNRIGMASVDRCVSIQATRGCPYLCVYCHKVWSKQHVFRRAEHIVEEIRHFYNKGVRNFSIIDDVFNLDRKNCEQFFRLLIKHKLDIRLFFPNGLRGDLLPGDLIDLMVEAGTRGINLSLESASPRLQKLLKKNLDIDKFRSAIHTIANKYPQVMLEIATMHGLPTETEEEAMMTLDFIKEVQWLHFPYIHILKIYPNTEMEALALESGISKRDILKSRSLAFHELPETLPFSKNFTRSYQAEFMNQYFLLEERLRKVLPVQFELLGEAATLEKYRTYMPVDLHSVDDILAFASIDDPGLEIPAKESRSESGRSIFDLPYSETESPDGAMRILLLDLSSHFSSHKMLYNVTEQPLGLLYLSTYLRRQFGSRVHVIVKKAGVDFDSLARLDELVTQTDPHLVGIRSLTFYREFVHQVAEHLRLQGLRVPIVAGGPYATSDYDSILKDRNIDVAVLGEGEQTMAELVNSMLANDFQLPMTDGLERIQGIGYRRENENTPESGVRVLVPQRLAQVLKQEDDSNLDQSHDSDLAYVMYTSGSTGKPKGVMVEHRSANNCIQWMQEYFKLDSSAEIVQRTDLTFDPSVWEIFWPLGLGGRVRVLDRNQRKDPQTLLKLMSTEGGPIMMYCPATLVTALAGVLNQNWQQSKLTMPWLVIGAEPISMETVKQFYQYYDGTIVNTYGPTECTINNTYYRLDPDDERSIVPIGKPVANNILRVLSPKGQLMPVGLAGEIWIAGHSLARGYINHPLKTAGGFVPDPFGDGLLYNTGDRGRWLEDGNIQILGRSDQQLKIRGYRIETGEIQHALRQVGGIDDCVVVAGIFGQDDDSNVRQCKRCGITDRYPGITIDDDGDCAICASLHQYKTWAAGYFSDLDELERTIRSKGNGNQSPYDCLLLYAGGRGATYALYQLHSMGLKVLAATYDNGYFGKRDLERIKRNTASLGVDHVVLTHPKSREILKESIRQYSTVCRGCFHTSSSLAGDYALKNRIPTVVGATLSRGQIIENKLYFLWQQGIVDRDELEREIAAIQRGAPEIDKRIFQILAIDSIDDGSVYQDVTFLDFFRFADVTNDQMCRFLEERDPSWSERPTAAVYSTNCPLKQLGDFGHLRDKGFHYYGGATSWQKRLGQLSLDTLARDLSCRVNEKGYTGFLEHMGLESGAMEKRKQHYLCAYVTGPQEIDGVKLRQDLAEHLPIYMIPNYFIQLEAIPLTVNGKVDRQALPTPEAGGRRKEDYVAAANGVEERLVQVWQQVLGDNKIGTTDNFFEMGGDSIKAIQIAAGLQQEGLKVEIRDIFSYPTIGQLAGIVKEETVTAPQEIIRESGPLTPIQQWLFRHHTGDFHHFNQSVMLRRPEGLDRVIVQRAFSAIVNHHDALRMVFEKDDNGHFTGQRNRGTEDGVFDISEYTIDASDRVADEIQSLCDAIQQGMNIEVGPLLRLGLFHTAEGDYLLVAIHHLVMDGVSWRLLLSDLKQTLDHLESGQEVELPLKTHPFVQWGRELHRYGEGDDAHQERDYWRTVMEAPVPLLPVDREMKPESRLVKDARTVSAVLDRQHTAQLLTEVHQAYHTEMNDVLLAAFGLALEQWSGYGSFRISLEGHGREEILPEMTVHRTIGWFTSRFPVLLEPHRIPCSDNGGARLGDWLKEVKEMMRRIPNKGIGYGILTDQDEEPEISFNYLGQFEQSVGDGDGSVTVADMPRGREKSLGLTTPYKIDVNGLVADEQLRATFTYCGEEYADDSMQKLADGFSLHLRRLVGHCMGKEESEMTLSDYDASDLDEDEMDAILDELDFE
jgi:amino acid adenylation domain-containing protein/non-ribosomal peptide synthase protein (TIGR01720 family)